MSEQHADEVRQQALVRLAKQFARIGVDPTVWQGVPCPSCGLVCCAGGTCCYGEGCEQPDGRVLDVGEHIALDRYDAEAARNDGSGCDSSL